MTTPKLSPAVVRAVLALGRAMRAEAKADVWRHSLARRRASAYSRLESLLLSEAPLRGKAKG